jgi:hypothetical protein
MTKIVHKITESFQIDSEENPTDRDIVCYIPTMEDSVIWPSRDLVLLVYYEVPLGKREQIKEEFNNFVHKN